MSRWHCRPLSRNIRYKGGCSPQLKNSGRRFGLSLYATACAVDVHDHDRGYRLYGLQQVGVPKDAIKRQICDDGQHGLVHRF